MRQQKRPMKESAAKATERRPPSMVTQGLSAGLGWILFILLDTTFHLDDVVRLWVTALSMVFLIVSVDFLSKKLPSRVCWGLGVVGWIASFGAVWFYLSPAI